MDNMNPESEFPPAGVFQLPGEPAILINGVPDIKQNDCSHVLANSATDEEQQKKMSGGAALPGNTNRGEWLEGREIRKEFRGEYYTGTVSQFDAETGWYRVMYEDGNFEDFERGDLEDVLVPLDITVPLKTLALKIINKGPKRFINLRKARVSHLILVKLEAERSKGD